MNNKYKLIGFITVVVILVLIICFSLLFFKKPQEEKFLFENTASDDVRLLVNCDLVSYIEIGGKFNDVKAISYKGDNDISDKVVVSYYKDGQQVSKVDTDIPSEYVVRYEVRDGDNLSSLERLVIVSDNIKPELTFPIKTKINSLDALYFDVTDSVKVSDNFGDVSLDSISSLSSIPGTYKVKLTAYDLFGNKRSRNRIIEVSDVINFKYDKDLEIIFPKGNYTYKYSLDGITWNDCDQKIKLDIKGNVIAAVFENGVYLYSQSYFVK